MSGGIHEGRVREALRLVAEQDRHEQASPEVEARVMRQFAIHRKAQGLHHPAWKIAAAVIVMVSISTLLWLWEPETKPSSREASVVLPVPTPPPSEFAMPSVSETVRPIVRSAARRKSEPVKTTPREMESVTEFIPLANASLPFEQGQLLRVSMPASAMEAVGFPVHEDFRERSIEADILVGEEGLPRAIRFVRTRTNSQLR